MDDKGTKMVWPVYEFRPLPDSFQDYGWGGVRRYADGAWLDDDGEHDLAFIGGGVCLYFAPPYQRNIVCSWLTTHWTGGVTGHPRGGNPWHYALRDGESDWGGEWGRDSHPNERAGRAGMDKVCSERRAASGRHVEFNANDPIIAAGLLRERDTKKVFEWPRNLACMYCGAAPPVGLKAE